MIYEYLYSLLNKDQTDRGNIGNYILKLFVNNLAIYIQLNKNLFDPPGNIPKLNAY